MYLRAPPSYVVMGYGSLLALVSSCVPKTFHQCPQRFKAHRVGVLALVALKGNLCM
jgi:hypothetical protein